MQNHEPQFGHFFNCVLDPFSTETGRLDAALWHVIDAKSGHAINLQSADLDSIPHINQIHAVGEKSGLQTVGCIIDDGNGLFPILIGDDRDNRCQAFFPFLAVGRALSFNPNPVSERQRSLQPSAMFMLINHVA